MWLAALLLVAYLMSMQGLGEFMGHPAVFAFGLVAFGLLGMGPALGPRRQPDHDVDPALVEVERVGMTLRSIPDDRDRLA